MRTSVGRPDACGSTMTATGSVSRRSSTVRSTSNSPTRRPPPTVVATWRVTAWRASSQAALSARKATTAADPSILPAVGSSMATSGGVRARPPAGSTNDANGSSQGMPGVYPSSAGPSRRYGLRLRGPVVAPLRAMVAATGAVAPPCDTGRRRAAPTDRTIEDRRPHGRNLSSRQVGCRSRPSRIRSTGRSVGRPSGGASPSTAGAIHVDVRLGHPSSLPSAATHRRHA